MTKAQAHKNYRWRRAMQISKRDNERNTLDYTLQLNGQAYVIKVPKR